MYGVTLIIVLLRDILTGLGYKPVQNTDLQYTGWTCCTHDIRVLMSHPSESQELRTTRSVRGSLMALHHVRD